MPRIYLTGRVTIEHGGHSVDERHLPGRQGRLAFVFLMLHRDRPVSRAELAAVVWPDGPPRETDTALNALLSKTRAALRRIDLDDATVLDVRKGAVTVNLPVDAWIDVEDARNALDDADGARRAGDLARAWGHANVCVSIARRPLLPDEDAPWIVRWRDKLLTLRARGLECLSAVSAANREHDLAVQYAAEIVELQPFRETAYQHLMRMHAAAGNHAEALRVFARCREVLREELGANPSPPTEAIFLEILRGQT